MDLLSQLSIQALAAAVSGNVWGGTVGTPKHALCREPPHIVVKRPARVPFKEFGFLFGLI